MLAAMEMTPTWQGPHGDAVRVKSSRVIGIDSFSPLIQRKKKHRKYKVVALSQFY